MSLKKSNKPVIYSVGHSAYTSGAFISLLQSFSIESVADIRRNPGYSQYPWFNKELLVKDLEKAGIDYIHLESLGGRRVTQENSPNNRLRSTSMRGYADHMVTPEFKSSMQVLE